MIKTKWSHFILNCTCYMIRLDSKGTVKISDFGLSEEVYTSGYFRQNKKDAVRLPFKWMAPESLTDALFTSQSDVVNKIMYAKIIIATTLPSG